MPVSRAKLAWFPATPLCAGNQASAKHERNRPLSQDESSDLVGIEPRQHYAHESLQTAAVWRVAQGTDGPTQVVALIGKAGGVRGWGQVGEAWEKQ